MEGAFGRKRPHFSSSCRGRILPDQRLRLLPASLCLRRHCPPLFRLLFCPVVGPVLTTGPWVSFGEGTSVLLFVPFVLVALESPHCLLDHMDCGLSPRLPVRLFRPSCSRYPVRLVLPEVPFCLPPFSGLRVNSTLRQRRCADTKPIPPR